MIPSADEVLRGWKFVARRIGLEPVANVRAVEAALDHARALSTRSADEPAAIFYAFACRPRALVGGGRYMPALMAINEVHRAGLELRATRDEFEALRKRLGSGSHGTAVFSDHLTLRSGCIGSGSCPSA